ERYVRIQAGIAVGPGVGARELLAGAHAVELGGGDTRPVRAGFAAGLIQPHPAQREPRLELALAQRPRGALDELHRPRPAVGAPDLDDDRVEQASERALRQLELAHRLLALARDLVPAIH